MGLISWFKGKEKTDWGLEDITFQLCKESDEAVYSALKTKFLEGGNLNAIRYSQNCIPDIRSGKQQTLELNTSNIPRYTEVYRTCFNAIKNDSKLFDHRILGYTIRMNRVFNNIFSESCADVDVIGIHYKKTSEDEYHFGLVGKKTAIKKYLEKICADKNFWIEDEKGGYVLHNVVHNGRFCNIGLNMPFLLGNERRTQESHIKTTKNSRIRVPSSVLCHTMLEMLHNHKDHPDENQRNLVKIMKRVLLSDFNMGRPYFATSSIARYGSGRNEVIHDSGYSNEQKIEIKADLTGSDRFIDSDQTTIENIIEAVLGTKNLDKVEKVYTWLSGKKPRLLRETNPVLNGNRCVVLGNAEPNQFDICLTGSTDAKRLSRGVVVEYT